jgi:hypothetical protein
VVPISKSIPQLTNPLGVEVTSGLAKAEEASDLDVLRKFEVLPKLFSGRQITVEFALATVRAAFAEDCVALHLEHGASVASHVTIESGQTFYVYGERDVALALLKLAKGSTIRARANTAFGTCTQAVWTDDGPIPEVRAENGLIITQILDVEPPTTD